jgi:hypothetical protein
MLGEYRIAEGAGALAAQALALAHVPAKWTPVRRQEHAQMKRMFRRSGRRFAAKNMRK